MERKTKAWHLRQDGKAFQVPVHLYVDDMASAAQAACFLITTESSDIEEAKYVLDSWMAMLIENIVDYDADEIAIEEAIRLELSKLPYKFVYNLTADEYIEIHNELGNYCDVDSLYDYVDSVKESESAIIDTMKQSLNQQFCRVRYGGQYNDEIGSSALWFRISSVGYNWADTIYVFTANCYRGLHVDSIFICRDSESDGSPKEYFYRAKDGEVYFNMPIDEYLAEDHEHSPVFNTKHIGSGVYHNMFADLVNGCTYREALNNLAKSGIDTSYIWDKHDTWKNIECASCMCSEEYMNSLTVKQRSKLTAVQRAILKRCPELDGVDVDADSRPNTKGRNIGFELRFTLYSSMIPELNNEEIVVTSTKAMNTVTADWMVGAFELSYKEFCEDCGISRSFRPDVAMGGYVWGNNVV